VSRLRVAIVDDLALARAVLRRIIDGMPDCQLAWEAANGAEALAKVRADKPDVLLMDLVMPEVDGVSATKQIMTASPLPIIIVTSSVNSNLSRVYEALSHGGLDAVNTPTFDPQGNLHGEGPLVSKLAAIARSRQRSAPAPIPASVSCSSGGIDSKIVAIGASTGGPDAVARVLADLGKIDAPIIIVQHIGHEFTAGLASWLTTRVGRPVTLARDGARPEAGTIILAGGDLHLTIVQGQYRLSAEPRELCYCPSVDRTFESLPGSGAAALLTGMGADGARGLLSLRHRGWHTIAQDEATSVVFGMPKAAIAIGAATEVLPIAAIGHALRRAILAVHK
jgi:two-component system, chemotaxis family, response regulator WspF